MLDYIVIRIIKIAARSNKAKSAFHTCVVYADSITCAINNPKMSIIRSFVTRIAICFYTPSENASV